jgi:hypothetical protein
MSGFGRVSLFLIFLIELDFIIIYFLTYSFF